MSLRISLRELEVFVAVAELDTVTRAAERVALTQSAASQALDKLEQGLGAKLFDRVGRRLLINEHGRLLLPRARALLDAAGDVQGLFDGGGLALRIGASTTIANYLLPPLLAAFRRDWPQARLELEVANTRDIVEAVAAFRVDFGLIEGPCHHPELLASPWRQDELLVFAAVSHPLAGRKVAAAELAEAEWILREAGSGTREEVERVLLPHLMRLSISMELGHSEAIKHAVAAGLGVSCLSRHVVADLLAAGSVVEVDADLPRLTRTLYRVQHRDKAIGRGMAAFDRHLK
ncbi:MULTISPECIES: LysR family transcriptional regulator [Chromobacteriaceae]|uniref:LysR family transcriptional regulator n=3 Tax=Chromobacteriaceae TaxID=1499392 RepID=A0ABV0FCN8_9NEIS|nr:MULTISPECIES: LysR family transcriptional regulator [Chromobacteriaceae]AVG14767.1 LysR family transcriptional regulator [Chromobacterium vaccinii]ERE07061.1 transcriptional regulator [Pseudogulbenkiania ferrooxidans EGD-HP2]MCD4498266.1 LysR family transcriptional regulator [Chromobacterium vaccinii]